MTPPPDIRPIRQGTRDEWTELALSDGRAIQCKGRWQDVEGWLREVAKEHKKRL